MAAIPQSATSHPSATFRLSQALFESILEAVIITLGLLKRPMAILIFLYVNIRLYGQLVGSSLTPYPWCSLPILAKSSWCDVQPAPSSIFPENGNAVNAATRGSNLQPAHELSEAVCAISRLVSHLNRVGMPHPREITSHLTLLSDGLQVIESEGHNVTSLVRAAVDLAWTLERPDQCHGAFVSLSFGSCTLSSNDIPLREQLHVLIQTVEHSLASIAIAEAALQATGQMLGDEERNIGHSDAYIKGLGIHFHNSRGSRHLDAAFEEYFSTLDHLQQAKFSLQEYLPDFRAVIRLIDMIGTDDLKADAPYQILWQSLVWRRVVAAVADRDHVLDPGSARRLYRSSTISTISHNVQGLGETFMLHAISRFLLSDVFWVFAFVLVAAFATVFAPSTQPGYETPEAPIMPGSLEFGRQLFKM